MINACGDDPAFVDNAHYTRCDVHLFLVRHAKVDTGGLMYGGGTDPEPVDEGLASSTEIAWLSAEIQRRSRCARELESHGFSGEINVFSSPLIRAARTARAIARVDFGDHNKGMYSFIKSPDRADDLMERNFGDLEGKPFVDMLAEHGGSWQALYDKARDNEWARKHGVETQAEVIHRTQRFLHDNVDQRRRRDVNCGKPQVVFPQHLVIVGHRASLRVMLGVLLKGKSTEMHGSHRVPGLTPSAIAFSDSIGLDNLSLTHVVIRYNDGDYNKTSEDALGSADGTRTGSRGEVTIRAMNLTCPETDEPNPWLKTREERRALAAEVA